MTLSSIQGMKTSMSGQAEAANPVMAPAASGGHKGPLAAFDVNYDKEYSTLRYRLDQLEYREWLDPASTPLVKRLLQDLIATTQTAREWKGNGAGMQEEIRVLSEQVSPLRKELAGLEHENGVLHREIIDLQDIRDQMSKQHQAALRKAQNEIQELRFLNSQLNVEVGKERDLARAASKKVEELGERIGILNPGQSRQQGRLQGSHSAEKISREKLFERVQKIDIETGLAPLQQDRPYFPPPNPSFMDLVALSDQRLEKEMRAAKEERAKAATLQEEIAVVLDQLGKRDREITRLSSNLELARSSQFTTGTRPTSAHGFHGGLGGITDLDGAKDRIQHLELQVESLHTHIEALESEIADMEGQKVTVLTSVADEKKKVELELEKERKRTALLVSNLSKMEEAVQELEGLRKDPPVGPNGGQIKPSTAVKNAKLVQELQTKLSAASVKSEQSSKRLQMLQKDLNRLQGDNGRLKARIAELEKLDKGSAPVSEPNAKTSAPEPTAGREDIKELETRYLECLRSHDTLQARLNVIQSENQNMTSSIFSLTAKLDQTDRMLQDLKIERSALTKQVQEGNDERHTLVSALDEFEGIVEEVQQKVTEVTRDRDVVRGLYDQVHAELERLRREKGLAPPSPSAVVAAPDGSAKEIQAENVELRKTCQLLEGEISSLKDDLKAMITRQRENGSLASEAVDLLEKELRELKELLEFAQAEKQRIEVELETVRNDREALRSTNDTLARQASADSSRLSQYALDVEKLRLDIRQTQLLKAEAEARIEAFAKETSTLQSRLAEKERVIDEQRRLLDEIDKERDGFQRDLDAKAEKLLELQDHSVVLQRKIESAERNNTVLQGQVDSLTTHLNNSDRECSVISRQLQDTLTAAKHWEEQAQQYHNEGQRISSDLVALTRENQILNGELGETSSARDRYRAELAQCESELAKLNELVKAKDEEKHEVLVNYRKLIADFERLDLAHRSNVEEGNNLRMELVSRDKKLSLLQKELDQIHRDANQLHIDNSAHTKQHSNLSRALATSERQIKQLESDKQRLTRELQSARELAHSVDRGKETIHSNYVQLTLEHERLQHTVEKMTVEMNALDSRCKAEHLKSERLEQLLNAERTRQIQAEKSGKDMKQSQAHMENRLKSLADQQEISLGVAKGQLEDMRRDLMASNDRVVQLETLMAQKEKDLQHSKALAEDSKRELDRLQDILYNKERQIRDLTELYVLQPTTSRDSRILSELAETQKERDQVAQQLAETALSPSHSNSSLASKETTGNNDAVGTARFVQNVMETIVQSQDEDE
ncbi:hypothetical protein HDV03_000235 [Kappamyces sp. JEL0829]|nr:hypothetical protein HDV03_000235 [Kappamyces sp. JEL0829]